MNPHSPIEPEGTFDGLRGSAILFGAMVDVSFTLVAGLALVVAFEPSVFSSEEATAQMLLAKLQTSDAFAAANLLVGALGTVIGAFAGARRAGQLHVRHGGWIAVLSTVIGTAVSLLQPSTLEPDGGPPLWAQVASVLLILPAGVAGGALAGWRQRRARR